MLVLVTGATGFVGSHATRAILASGHDVRLLVRDERRARLLFGDVAEACKLVRGDVTDPAAVEAAVDGCDAVVHAAAMVALHRKHAEEAHRTNTTGAANVLGAAARAGCDPILHISSVSVLETTPPLTTKDAPLRQSTGGYSASKVDCEWLCRGMQAAGLPVVTVYPSGVTGPDAPSVTPVHTMVITSTRAMPMTSSGFNLIDVRDLALMIAAALQPGLGARRLMASGRYLPWAEFLDVCDQVRGRKVIRYPAPGPALRAVGRFVDLTHIRLPVDFELSHETMVEATRACEYDSAADEAALGVTPRPIAETMADTYRWLYAAGHITAKDAGTIAG
ncbi:MAG: NAD-dependent epimerase/dehydratase family protein [Actinobacteria bacterium]|nr:NAD-dependent epimerase/dehydratase family protein [Actinomycetota bacterium]